MVNLYLDANVYLDYWEDRRDNIRPLGEFAFNLIRRAINCEFVICYSDFLLFEVCKSCNLPKEEIFEQIFRPIENAGKLRHIMYTYENEAKIISKENGMHRTDAIHIAIAEKCNAILITRDNQILDLKGKFHVAKPEEL